jgi:hypothetical protein
MKVSLKIYHILQAELKKAKQAGEINTNYLAGYKAALVDSLKVETEINKGNIDYIIGGDFKGRIVKPKEL